MSNNLVFRNRPAMNATSDASRFGVWSEGYIVDDAGSVVHTYQVNVPGPDSESPGDRWRCICLSW